MEVPRTVVLLKAEAKARGFKGYSKLRKAQLITLLHGQTNSQQYKDIYGSPAPKRKKTKSYKPCKPGQERNKVTNRCKKSRVYK